MLSPAPPLLPSLTGEERGGGDRAFESRDCRWDNTMAWYTLSPEFVRSNEFGYSIYGPLSGRWRFVDDGQFIDEIDWTPGLCGYVPCLKYAIRETTNTASILREHGFPPSGELVPYARPNNGLSPGTTVGDSTWGWKDWLVIVGVALVLWFFLRRRR